MIAYATDLVPVLRNALDAPWFIGMELLGTVAFAISGLVLARRDKFSLVGAFVLAGLPAAGGGIMRDLIVGRRPVAFLSTPLYVTLIVGTVVVGFLVFRVVDVFRHSLGKERTGRFAQRAATAIEFFDALGLAAFMVTGVVVAVETTEGSLLVWGPLFAVITATGGGILRDVVRSDKDNPALKRVFYTEVALTWGFLLSLFLTLFAPGMEETVISLAVMGAVAGAFATRMLAVHYHWNSPRFSLRTSIDQESIIISRSVLQAKIASMVGAPGVSATAANKADESMAAAQFPPESKPNEGSARGRHRSDKGCILTRSELDEMMRG